MTQILNEYLFNTQHQSSHLFSVLSVEERSELTDTAVTRLIRKGHSIFEEGQQPQGLVFLAKGSAKVYKVGTGVREQIVRLVRPQSFVGYKALFAEKAHTTTAEAMDASEIIVYNKEVLFRIMDVNPAFSRRIIRALANELSFNYSRLINLTQKHIRGRLAETLLLISELYGFEEDGSTLKASFTRENLAHFSNMTTSNAIRTLKVFEKEGLILTKGKRLGLIDHVLLREISESE